MAYSGASLDVRMFAGACSVELTYNMNSLLVSKGQHPIDNITKAYLYLESKGLISDDEAKFMKVVARNGNLAKHEFFGKFSQEFVKPKDLNNKFQALVQKWIPRAWANH